MVLNNEIVIGLSTFFITFCSNFAKLNGTVDSINEDSAIYVLRHFR